MPPICMDLYDFLFAEPILVQEIGVGAVNTLGKVIGAEVNKKENVLDCQCSVVRELSGEVQYLKLVLTMEEHTISFLLKKHRTVKLKGHFSSLNCRYAYHIKWTVGNLRYTLKYGM